MDGFRWVERKEEPPPPRTPPSLRQPHIITICEVNIGMFFYIMLKQMDDLALFVYLERNNYEYFHLKKCQIESEIKKINAT
jgi:hypothetical protein